jgi:hypothetical protein
MSYDLLVFDPAAPPGDREGFLQWFDVLTQWNEGHDCNDPNQTTDALRAWFTDMIAEFPAMNGPFAAEDFDSNKITGYTICHRAICVDFRWTVLDEAYRATFDQARKHRLGFFDVSADDGQVWLPQGDDGFALAHGTGSSLDPQSAAQRVSASFKQLDQLD